MNTNASAIRILCYGDSNTWGYIPGTSKRYPVGVRWTGLLQKKLGEAYEVIEEGLNSRTTDLDDPKHLGKNGLVYLRPCLETHDSIDIIILMLGTNDMKERFNREPEQIANGIEELLKMVKLFSIEEETQMPQIILVSPPLIDESVDGVKDKYLGAGEKSKKLAKLFDQVATKYNCKFVDMAKYVSPSKEDGYHLEPESHQKVAEVIYNEVKTIG